MFDDLEALPTPQGRMGAEESAVRAAGVVAGRYALLGLVGTGGMGTVYRAHDRELDEVVALKLLRRDLTSAPDLLELFRTEVRLARRVTHVNVARIYDIGQHGEDRFISMEYIAGQPLSALIESGRSLALKRALPILRAVCAGVAAVHAAGVVHRDLKPENVLLGSDGRVAVTDFGIACMLSAQAGESRVVGTPHYMAPEQVRIATDLDARADVYAIGAILYELATGRPPWPVGDLLARLRSRPRDPRELCPHLSDRVAELALRCLDPDPAQRPATALALGAELEAVEHEGAPSPYVVSLASAGARPLALSMIGRQTLPPRHKSVAVLPFQRRGPEADDVLVRELGEELVDVLASVPGLRLRPYSTTAALGVEHLEVARATLGVQVLVLGSVERRGEQFRVGVRLVTAGDGYQLWARRFDCPLTGLLDVADQAALAIAERLTVELATPRRLAPSNPEAMDLYLRGRAALRDVWPSRNSVALQLLGRAHDLAPEDPTIAAAYARACTRRWFWSGAAADADRAREVIGHAEAMGPDSAEVALAKAGLRFMVNDHAGAVTELKLALGRSPSFAEARELLGRVALELGRTELGLRQLRAAEQLDPRWGQPVEIARALALLGRWDEVAELLARWAPEPEEVSAKAIVCARLALWAPAPAPLLAALPPLAAVTEPGRAYVELATEVRVSGVVSAAHAAAFANYLDGARESLRFRVLIHQLAAEAELYAAKDAREPGVGLLAAATHVAAAVAAGLADRGWLEACPLLAPLRNDRAFQVAADAVRARTAAARAALDDAT